MRILPWQKRRSTFNHDWLKNRFMVALAKYLNLLEGKIEDRDFEKSFVQGVLPEWELHRGEAMALARDFEHDMSPRTMFDRHPLSLCDDNTKRWLGNCLHALWLSHYPVKCWIAEAGECVTKVDGTYSRLRNALSECEVLRSDELPKACHEQLVEFKASCHSLAKAIEKFPCAVRVP